MSRPRRPRFVAAPVVAPWLLDRCCFMTDTDLLPDPAVNLMVIVDGPVVLAGRHPSRVFDPWAREVSRATLGQVVSEEGWTADEAGLLDELLAWLEAGRIGPPPLVWWSSEWLTAAETPAPGGRFDA